MLNGNLIDITLPSALSLERRVHLNQLAKVTAEKINEGDEDYISCLLLESLGLQEIFEEVLTPACYMNFYRDINRAFELLLKEDAAAFRTFSGLTTMLRVFAKHERIVETELSEANRIVSELNQLDQEEIDLNKKGGQMLSRKQELELRKQNTINDFYSYTDPSDYLNTLKYLTSHYILSFEEDDLCEANLNKIIYMAGQIGEFIVKLKEDCDIIEKFDQKGASHEE